MLGSIALAARVVPRYDSRMPSASIAANGNHGIENIGARRLHTVLEKLLEEISFTASERSGEAIVIEAKDVAERVGVLAKNADLSKFIL